MGALAFRTLARRGSLTRGLYAFVVLLAPGMALYLLVIVWLGYASELAHPMPWYRPSPPLLASAIALPGFILPGFRAWARVIGGRELIPAERFQERPMMAAMVALFGGFASFMAILITSIVADVIEKAADDIGGPLGLFCAIMAMAAAIALLIGEVLVVGRDRLSRDPPAVS